MSLFNDLGALLGGGQTGNSPSLISSLLSEGGAGGLQGVVGKLQAAGFGDHVSSWLGDGSNIPISADQIRTALGDPLVQQIAAKVGLPLDGVLTLLSQHLPNAVDKASPDGTLQPDQSST